MVIIAPGFIFVWFLPNQNLNYVQSWFTTFEGEIYFCKVCHLVITMNLVEDHGMLAGRQNDVTKTPTTDIQKDCSRNQRCQLTMMLSLVSNMLYIVKSNVYPHQLFKLLFPITIVLA